MRYVLVPVPTEYVLDVMRMVLFRSADAESDGGLRDAARLKRVLEEADELTRSILAMVAGATGKRATVRLADAADELEVEGPVVVAAVKDLNAGALGGGRSLVRLANETAVRVSGNLGQDVILEMRPEHAQVIRTLLRGAAASDD